MNERTASQWWGRALSSNGTGICLATVALFVASPIVAPASLGSAPLLGMLPFAAVLAIIAAGQTIVVQQRGLDLSVPGMIALGAVLATNLPQGRGWPLWAAVLVAVLATGLVGVINGLVITRLGVMPLVVTLGMNTVLLGIVFAVANGTPSGASNALNQFALDRTLGVPNTVLVALVVVLVAGLVTSHSVIGHRLTAIGVSERAGAAAGLRVGSLQVAAYGLAGVCYGAGAVLLAGYTKTPPLFLGDSYLLPSVAAVVLGGTALSGGVASVVCSGVAALFITQLGQLLRSIGWSDASQLVTQAIVLLAVVLLRELLPRLWRSLRSREPAGTVADAVPA